LRRGVEWNVEGVVRVVSLSAVSLAVNKASSVIVSRGVQSAFGGWAMGWLAVCLLRAIAHGGGTSGLEQFGKAGSQIRGRFSLRRFQLRPGPARVI